MDCQILKTELLAHVKRSNNIQLISCLHALVQIKISN